MPLMSLQFMVFEIYACKVETQAIFRKDYFAEKFPKVVVGFQKFWAETFSMRCSHVRFTPCLGILLLNDILFASLSTNWPMI